jgi:biopolymer transport protein ExbB
MNLKALAGLAMALALAFTGVDAHGQGADEVPVETQDEQLPEETQAPSVADLTLSDMVEQGGVILWVIIGLSVLTVILAAYLFFTVTPSREIPPNFVKRAMAQLRSGDLRSVYQMCEGRDELVANVLRAGLKVSGHDRYVVQEAMESEGERGATALWQKISYLNNIGVISPLLGLLGTVWGMIKAFAAISIEDASARGLALAYNVAQAMITTAAGLLLAIPALVIYFILRGRVIRIVSQLEAQASEMVEVLTRSQSS